MSPNSVRRVSRIVRADKLGSFITFINFASNWWVRGPYPKSLLEEQSAERELDPFALPQTDEQDGASSWQFVHEASLRYLDMKRVIDAEEISAYGQLRVFSAKRQNVEIEFSCHHAVRLWLKGKLLHSDSADEKRELGDEVDTIDAVLEPGWNTVLVKASVLAAQIDWGSA